MLQKITYYAIRIGITDFNLRLTCDEEDVGVGFDGVVATEHRGQTVRHLREVRGYRPILKHDNTVYMYIFQ